jgi:DNA-binding transcriptional LysR family regulator
MEESFRPHLARGELVPMLEDYLPRFPGFFLYYPRRERQPAKLRALVEHLRRTPDDRRKA